jgi:hypothetical protein
MQGVKGGSGKDSLLIVPSEIVLPVQGKAAAIKCESIFLQRIKAKRGDCQQALLPMQEGGDQVVERSTR